ncbi:hypothetical protein ANANG_G00235700 [Anguilla anguilla]|uniref:Cysteine and histidine-rich domain-containing protein 1 n=2 Tax=Anguilla anguilla TaxID=7936 RepID=A0A9D3RRK2_ANGAN|nr:hypothetical protein ANANG_G00235700 [Anguilla anguilla]
MSVPEIPEVPEDLGADMGPEMESFQAESPPSPAPSYLSMESDEDQPVKADEEHVFTPVRVDLERAESQDTRQNEIERCSVPPREGAFFSEHGPDAACEPISATDLLELESMVLETEENLSPMELPFIFKLIQRTLQQLTEQELSLFKKYLSHNHSRYFENRMEDFDVLDVVDKMLERCGKVIAVKVALHVLKCMKRNDLADFLEAKSRRVMLQHDLKEHLKMKYETIFEGIPRHGQHCYLGNIYTDVLMTEGGHASPSTFAKFPEAPGCGQRFDPDKNPDDSCTYHPGVPVFHDALKGWSCCKRRTTDFSDFLSIAGCTKGPHNKEKPPQPVKPDVKTSGEKKELEDLKPKFNEYQSLEKLKLSEVSEPEKKEEEGDEVKIGTSCKNGGCSKTFNGPGSNEEACMYHPGVPIFHEGMKYWSCCKRKTSDFNTFLSQEGCTKGKHLWKKEDTGKKIVPCRFDWHQTGSQVMISVYARNSIPELSFVEGNSTKLNIHIIFEGEKEFQHNINLWGVIDVNKSVMNMMATKIEIAMKKAEPMTWARLDLPPVKIQPAEKKENADEDPDD